MKKSLSERMESGKVETTIETTIQKGKQIMEKKEIKVIKGIGNIQLEDTSAMIRFFADRMKPVLMQDASNHIRNGLSGNKGFYFDNIVKAKDFEYLSEQFDLLIQEALKKAKQGKDENLEIEGFEQFLSAEMIEEYKATHTTKEYTFSELQEDIVLSFEAIQDKLISLYNAIII